MPQRSSWRSSGLVSALALALACAGPGPGEETASESDDAATSSGGETSTSSATEASATTTTTDTGTSAATGTTSTTSTTSTTGTTGTTSTTSTTGATDETSDGTDATDTEVDTSTTGLDCPVDGPSFAAELFPIIEARCGCHKVSYPDAATTYAGLVGQPSKGVPALTLIEPCDVAGSYFLSKLRDTQIEDGGLGTRMPPDKPLSPAELDLFDAWVAGGAPP